MDFDHILHNQSRRVHSGSHLSGNAAMDEQAKISAAYVPKTLCLSVTILGAAGDLARKKTYPALFQLFKKVHLQ
jgi:hypothetical protein